MFKCGGASNWTSLCLLAPSMWIHKGAGRPSGRAPCAQPTHTYTTYMRVL